MEFLDHLALGFGVAMSLQNLAYCFLGVLLGTLIGVLPGVGPLVTISMLLPITFGLPPVASVIMLAGIYYGAQYGGSTTAILVNLPGETSSAVTCLDGYQMARQGRAGAALAIAALSSFVAGCIGTILIVALGVPLAGWALRFGAEDYFALMLLGLVAASVLTHGDLLKALAMVILGLLIGLVGTDVNSGMERYTFGLPELADGIGFTVLAVGIFAVAEVVSNLEQKETREVFTKSIGRLMPSWPDLKASFLPTLRGTAIGSFFGILPGTGPSISSFSSYMVEKKLARDPSRFGRGAIEGVASPEAANNAAAQTAFIPMLTLGIPGSATMALILGALVMNGIQPGPSVMTRSPELFWGVIASMFIGNAMLVALNLPLVGIWVRLLTIPYRWLFPAIILFCALGNYSLNNSAVDVYLCAAVGVLGYVFAKLQCPPAPLILGYVLGPMMEENIRRALLLSEGDLSIFVKSPISATLLVISALLLVSMILPAIRAKKEQAYAEG
ncbi:tripartite tricarboxylate transporter permease [Bosea sp. (in: a-proteobacteria)]|uniref:tripartite tricarboxylate transporter permease n=1 Tax=Bosea sp. (in: a-proteobacteria) TaxID=1871050 RepID=UPI003B3A4A1D